MRLSFLKRSVRQQRRVPLFVTNTESRQTGSSVSLQPQTVDPLHLLDLSYRLPRHFPGFTISTVPPSLI